MIKVAILSRMRIVPVVATAFWRAACGPVITASNRVLSPDGHWAAVIESRQLSGSGNDFDATQISLQQAKSPPFEILGFPHEYATMKLQLVWESPVISTLNLALATASVTTPI